METRSFTIPVSKLVEVQNKLIKLNKRAVKLGMQEIVWTVGKARVETVEVLYQDPDYPEMLPQYVKREVLLAPFDITGPLSVNYDGWTFVATLQHLPTGETIIRSISDEVAIPIHYRDTGSACEHCKANRYRKDTYLLHHEADDGMIQVGSTCIKDFLGGNSPDDILNKANLLSELISYLGGMEGGGGGGDCNIFSIESFLAQTSACIRDHGWLSKGKAFENGGKSTSSWVFDNFRPPLSGGFKFSCVMDDDKEKAKLAAEWVESLTDAEVESSDYLYNIRSIARSGMVDSRTMGFAASIVPAYERAMGNLASKKPSKHVGEIKKRTIFNLVLKRHFSFDTNYGTTHSYIFEDDDGNIMVWKASAPHDMVEGKRYGIKGTVKEHSEYKGVPQTLITRCEVMTHDSNH